MVYMPPNLKRSIGYDKEGAQQLKGKLVDTNKWIGTAGDCCSMAMYHSSNNLSELYVAFTSRSIP